jgi:hypothetical protein
MKLRRWAGSASCFALLLMTVTIFSTQAFAFASTVACPHKWPFAGNLIVQPDSCPFLIGLKVS